MPYKWFYDSLIRQTTWNHQVIFANNHVRFYVNEDFMVIAEQRYDFFHRSFMQRWVWAGPPYRAGLFLELQIPIYVIDDFGDLVQVNVKQTIRDNKYMIESTEQKTETK